VVVYKDKSKKNRYYVLKFKIIKDEKCTFVV